MSVMRGGVMSSQIPSGGVIPGGGITLDDILAAYPNHYYVNAITGNDNANDGKSLTAPWATTGKVNGFGGFAPGDYVSYARGVGQTFNDTALAPPTRLNVDTYGDPDDPKPIVGMGFNYKGSTGDWSNQGNGVWKRTCTGHKNRPMRVSLDRERASDRVGSAAEVGVEIKGIAGTTFTGDTISMTANRTSGQATLPVTAGLTQAQLNVIDGAVISGTGIPTGTTVLSHTGTIAGADAVLTMSANASSSSSNPVTSSRIFNVSKDISAWANDVTGARITGANVSTAHAQIFLTSTNVGNATADLLTGARAAAINTAAATGTTYTLTMWTQAGAGKLWSRYVLWPTARNSFLISLNSAKATEAIMREDDLIHFCVDGQHYVTRQNNSTYIAMRSSVDPTTQTSILISAGHFPSTVTGTYPNDTFDLYVFEPRGNPATFRTEVWCGSYGGAGGVSTKALNLLAASSGSTFKDLFFAGGTLTVVDMPTPSGSGLDANGQIVKNTNAVTDLTFIDCNMRWSGNQGFKPRHGCDNWLLCTSSASATADVNDNGAYNTQDQVGIKWGISIDEIVRGHRVIGHPKVYTDNGCPEIRGNFEIVGNGEDGLAGQAHDSTFVLLKWVTSWKNGENGADWKSNMKIQGEFCTLRTAQHLIGGAGVGGLATQAYCYSIWYDCELSMIAGRHDSSLAANGGNGAQNTPRTWTEYHRCTIFADSNWALTVGDDVGTTGKHDGYTRVWSSLVVSTRDTASTPAMTIISGDVDVFHSTIHKRGAQANDHGIHLNPTKNESGVATSVLNLRNSEVRTDGTSTSYVINRDVAAAVTGIFVNAVDCLFDHSTDPTNWMREKSDTPAFLTAAQVDAGVSGTTLINIANNKKAGGDVTITSAANNPWMHGNSFPGDHEKEGDLYLVGYSGGTAPQRGEMMVDSNGAIGWVRNVLTNGAAQKAVLLSRGSVAGDYGTPGYRKIPGNTTSYGNGNTMTGSFGASTTVSTTALTTNGHSISINTALKLRVIPYTGGSGSITDGNVLHASGGGDVILLSHTGTTAGVLLVATAVTTVIAGAETIGDGTFSATVGTGGMTKSPAWSGSRPLDPLMPYGDIMGRLFPMARLEAATASKIAYDATGNAVGEKALMIRNSGDTGVGTAVFNATSGTGLFTPGMDVWIVNGVAGAPSPVTGFGVISKVAPSATQTLGNNPIDIRTTGANPTIRITVPDTSLLLVNDTVTIAGAVGFNGLTAGNLNAAHPITAIVDPTHVDTTSAGTSTGTGTGGGAACTATYQAKSMLLSSASQTALLNGTGWVDLTPASANPFVLGVRADTGAFRIP